MADGHLVAIDEEGGDLGLGLAKGARIEVPTAHDGPAGGDPDHIPEDRIGRRDTNPNPESLVRTEFVAIGNPATELGKAGTVGGDDHEADRTGIEVGPYGSRSQEERGPVSAGIGDHAAQIDLCVARLGHDFRRGARGFPQAQPAQDSEGGNEDQAHGREQSTTFLAGQAPRARHRRWGAGGDRSTLGEGLEVGGHRRDRRVPVLGLLLHRLQADRLQGKRNFGADLAGSSRIFLDNGAGGLQLGLPLKRTLSGEHLVEHHPEREDVGPRVDRPVVSAGLLGTHVGKGAGHVAGLGEPVGLQIARQPEVGEVGPAFDIDEDVGGFDVAVQDLVLVSVGQRAGDPGDEASHALEVVGTGSQPQARVRIEFAGESAPLDVLGGQEGSPVLLAEVVDGHDRLVFQASRRPRLGLEARARGGTEHQCRREDLQGHAVPGLLFHREMDGAHAAAADFALETKSSDVLPVFGQVGEEGGPLDGHLEEVTGRIVMAQEFFDLGPFAGVGARAVEKGRAFGGWELEGLQKEIAHAGGIGHFVSLGFRAPEGRRGARQGRVYGERRRMSR